jgi:hypothetical protein
LDWKRYVKGRYPTLDNFKMKRGGMYGKIGTFEE